MNNARTFIAFAAFATVFWVGCRATGIDDREAVRTATESRQAADAGGNVAQRTETRTITNDVGALYWLLGIVGVVAIVVHGWLLRSGNVARARSYERAANGNKPTR